ncbi:L,D-transpeptidase [Chryseobacterium sp. G0201]|uniref:L,D-transpeptidase n=1 Tax=Chryseobacterium sp. G0201 TaxID=2487065 RepID=UPI000F4D4219|nr:L,D-transpeptidase [Chryseobacterium sp. G0201]AZA54735.1 murein L,D-transpeptidase [Chryseobacterium sp. G0201]
MSQLLIIGDKNPEIGKETKYTISLVNFGGLSNNISVFNPISEIPKWQILVLEHGKWRKTSENTKQGESVFYTFKQSSLSRESIKIVVTKGNDKGELIIKTKKAGQPKILKVDLLDVNYNKVTKPLHYFDTLIAKAQCTDMESEKLHFTLWEDDALKEGHNKINEINKINPIPISATVKRGKAEARFNMAFYTQASMIANMQLAKGDKSEGKNHEYYVTADYYGKLEASNNINIVNPAFENPIQRAYDLKYPDKTPQKPKVNKRPTPTPPAPKKDTYKTPITPKAKTKAPDPKGKIISVEFVDFLGKPYQNMKFGTQVKAKIVSKDMKGKTIKLKIWEDDISDQLVYENNYVLGEDESYATLSLTTEMRKKGDDFKEGSEQEYFLEIEYAGQSVDSEVINVNDSAPKIKVETGVSTSGVKQKTVQKQQGTCICQEQYKDLIWGGKVSCEFRKKVVEISQDLWPNNHMKMANNLMACMAWETGESFSPSAKNPESSATGLIQFMADTAKDLGTTTSALSHMSAVKQLDYVKKYFENIRNKDYEFVDLYLRILYPASMGKPDNHIVFSKNGKGLDKNDKNYNGRIKAYRVNSGFDTNPKYGNNDEMVTKEEIKKSIQIYIEKGKQNKATNFECQKKLSSPNVLNTNKEKGTWNIIITEYYTGKKCTHIERTSIRDNCRRGKIDVYDHKEKIVFTINDCLLEGVKGEDRSKTGADVPYGSYQINKSTPFYGSTAKNKKSYGPNPRLVFEPIKGNGDEAEKSGRSAIRIHGGRQEGYPIKTLKRTEGCIRIYDEDAKKFYNWWVEFNKNNPQISPGKVIIKK